MADTDAPAPRKRRPAGSLASEKRLLAEVLDLKDQVHSLVVSMERFTNLHAGNQMMAQRDIAALVERVGELETWQTEIQTERSEQRGAARARRSLTAALATLAGAGGGAFGLLLNRLFGGG